MILNVIQLAQRLSTLRKITVLGNNGKIRYRFIRRHDGFLWEPYKQDEYAVYYGTPMDDREVIHYVSGRDYVIFAR